MNMMNTEIINLYEDVLQRREHAFSSYFFAGTEGKQSAAIITQYVVETKEQWNRTDLCRNMRRQVLAQYRLEGMVKGYFNGSVFEVVDNAYPNQFKPWELLKARRSVFIGETGMENAKQAVRWLVQEKLQYTTEDYYKLNRQSFEKYHLENLLLHVYGGSISEAIHDAGLDDREPWEICRVPYGFWKGQTGYQHAISATKWLIECKLQLPLSKIPVLRVYDFEQHGLGNMLKEVFKGSPFLAVNAVYPDRFRKWEFASVGNHYWEGAEGHKHAREAMEWLIRDRLHEAPGKLLTNIRPEIFRQYGLQYMVQKVFHGSIQAALNCVLDTFPTE